MVTGVACNSDESVPLKSAMAILAVQRRQFDRELARAEERYESQKAELIRLTNDLETMIRESDPYLTLLSTFYEDDGGSCNRPSYGLTTMMTALRVWTATAQAAPQHQSLLETLWDYSMRLRLFPVLDGSPLPETPIRAILTVLTSMVSSQANKEQALLDQLTRCLDELLMILDTIYYDVGHSDGSDDFKATEEFILWVLAVASGVPELVDPLNSPSQTTPRRDMQQISGAIVNVLQASAGAGLILLGCTGQILKRAFTRLSYLATGKFRQSQNKFDEVDKSNENESELVEACLFLTGLLQDSLRRFRDSTCSVITPSEGFLSTLTSQIWSINDMASIVAPMYPDIARQGHCCTSLLISVLQLLSSDG
jgi:hypothetical protein